jgi:methylmalonyl-CoA/ethylmalonyl-CoA epimerase
MRPRGVNRVTIAVKDLDKGIALYSRLLGATFHDQSTPAEPYGLRCAISWDAGIELVAPLRGRDSFAEKHIARHGEGLMGVVFAVDDVDEGRQRAEEMGIGVLGLIEYDQNQIREYHQDMFKKYKEYMMNPADTYGVGVVLGQIELK